MMTRLPSVLFLLLAINLPALAVEPSQNAAKKKEEAKAPQPQTHYMGREIAPFMSHLGAPWLTRDDRDQEENTTAMLKNLHIKEGMSVCDLGCGNGYYTLKLASMVGPEGKVYAVDIQAEMLRLLEDRAKKENVKNIELIHGLPHDPRLPEGKIDLVLLVDVYHEFSNPKEMLATIRKSLSPKGRLVLLEFRLEDPKVNIKLLHKMSKRQVHKELTANGFKLAEEFDGLPIQHLLFFERDEDWKPGDGPKEYKPLKPATP